MYRAICIAAVFGAFALFFDAGRAQATDFGTAVVLSNGHCAPAVSGFHVQNFGFGGVQVREVRVREVDRFGRPVLRVATAPLRFVGNAFAPRRQREVEVEVTKIRRFRR